MTIENVKEGASLITDSIEKNTSQVQSLTENVVKEFKSVGDNITKELKSAFESQEKEKIKLLEDQLANKEHEIKSLNSNRKISNVNVADIEEKSLKSIASILSNKDVISLFSEEYKSIRFSDSITTDTIDKPSIRIGEVDVNKLPLTNILNDIDILPPLNVNEGSVAWNGYDESLVDLYDANEMDSAKLSEVVKFSIIKLSMRQVQSKMLLSTQVIQDILTNGNQTATLNRNLRALENRYDRKLAATVFQDIISATNNSLVTKIASTNNDATADDQARKDLRLFPSNLKIQYINNAALYISRKFLNSLFSTTATDGHLPLEQFVFENGINYFITPEKAIPIRVFEHAQIGDYKSLDDGTTSITSDYIDGGENTGKLLAIVADLKYTYKLIPSSIGTIGYDASISNLLSGVCPAGKISYAAQGIIAKEAIKVFYGK